MKKRHFESYNPVPEITEEDLRYLRAADKTERESTLRNLGVNLSEKIHKVSIDGELQIIKLEDDFFPVMLAPMERITDINSIDIENIKNAVPSEREELWSAISEFSRWKPEAETLIEIVIDGKLRLVYVDENLSPVFLS